VFRWHPLRGEWVAYAAHRQQRTFMPPANHNPLLPSNDPARPAELPCGNYDIAVFDNLFPAMREHPDLQSIRPGAAAAPTGGHCEVVVFSQDAHASLASLPLSHVQLLIEVWGHRTRAMRARPGIRYVLPFENRGAEVGVTLHHPHGQIYGYPFVPPVPGRMHAMELEHLGRFGVGLLGSIIAREVADAARIVYEGEHAVAFVPACARYPYEVWIATRLPVPDFLHLSVRQREDLARAIKTTLLKYDGLWGEPFPYIMAWYQAPFDDTPREAYHLHAQCLPPYRMRGRLKYLAGTEIAGGMFVNDTLPEDKAAELRAVIVNVGAN
jgi:UDPglucose--hexose-1-phosphate uridylyltransferase